MAKAASTNLDTFKLLKHSYSITGKTVLMDEGSPTGVQFPDGPGHFDLKEKCNGN